MSLFTRSGARRGGDEYQDLQSAEVLISWLEQPETYNWVRLETMEGSLDDIQAEVADKSRRLWQVKYGTDPSAEWTWEELTKQESGKKGLKNSLLQKWKHSLDDVLVSGVRVSKAALLTNRAAGPEIRAHLTDSGLVDFTGLSEPLQAIISEQLGGTEEASLFFRVFQFSFKDPNPESLGLALQERFSRLGGTREGWSNLLDNIRRWINQKDEPNAKGYINLADVRSAALWHLPQPIPQAFLVPPDYVAPKNWSKSQVKPLLRNRHGGVLVVTGSPGVGKSTYLSWLVSELRRAEVPVVRHHFYLSNADATPHRTEWETAAKSIIQQLRFSHERLVRGVDSQNPLPGTLRQFIVEAGQKRAGKNPLVVIVDGLDHVWRDTGKEEGLRRLFDRLLPAPEGVVVVVGTQDVDVSRIPLKLRNLCPREQWLEIPFLEAEGVYSWLKYHRDELSLPQERNYANRTFSELAVAFYDISHGHPLILHFSLKAVLQQYGSSINAEQVRTLTNLGPNSNIGAYYRSLWIDISPEGHQLLHLLAGFPWAWPRAGLLECLAPHGDQVRLEQAEKAIRHVLGKSRAGVTAFHESLLVFVRDLPEHRDAVASLRPQVINWLSNLAPEYWKWRYEWEERARNNEEEPLVSSATLDWAIDSLTAGRGQTEVSEIVASSAWVALRNGHLGVATERQLAFSYLMDADREEAVLWRLLWLSLLCRDLHSRELELNLFLSRKEKASHAEIEAVGEVAFSAGLYEQCKELLDEAGERWDTALRRSEGGSDSLTALEKCMPTLIAACLTTQTARHYRSYLLNNGDEPEWCLGKNYLKALSRLCIVGEDNTQAIRDELRFLANKVDKTSFAATEEIVRLACRDGFDPDPWIENGEARRVGLFRCHRLWVMGVKETAAEAPRQVSFKKVWETRFGSDEDAYVELASSYFFSSLSGAAEGWETVEPIGLNEKASKVRDFLSMLCDLATEAAASKNNGNSIGAAWLMSRLTTLTLPKVEVNDYENRVVRAEPIARIIVSIAQDLEELHFAETGETSLTRDALMNALESPWTGERVWIKDRVDRRLTMRDRDAWRLLLNRELARLKTSRDYLQNRAEEYASLAQFSKLHQGTADEILTMARMATKNLLGQGYHKDLTLDDLLDGIRIAYGSGSSFTLDRLKALSPIIRVVDEITDGDETKQLKRKLADLLRELVPEVLPSYLRVLQRDHHHAVVESVFTDIAEFGPLETVFQKALTATLIHDEALSSIKKRSDKGDFEAKSVLVDTLNYCGREWPVLENSESNSYFPTEELEKESPPSIEEYTPDRLEDFIHAVRDARLFGDEHLAAWTTHWISEDPDRLLTALAAYKKKHIRLHEVLTGKKVVGLAWERAGSGSAWEWLVAYHKDVYGWNRYVYPIESVEWIWEFVRNRFSGKWLNFIIMTNGGRLGPEGGSPGWSIARMARFLSAMGLVEKMDEVLDAAVRWGAGLAADMSLPDHALIQDQPALPEALRLLVDRLDCPSRMVQERAGWCLAKLLATTETGDSTTKALLDWHSGESIELRSCMLLLILHLAHISHGFPADACVKIARQANLVPSLGSVTLLREFGETGRELAAAINYQERHSGPPKDNFSGVGDFDQTVNGHLAPSFNFWAEILNKSGFPFIRQWQWEATELARRTQLSLKLKAHFQNHYYGSLYGPSLTINDKLAVMLRSAYLRALHFLIQNSGLKMAHAEYHAKLAAVMIDPSYWAVRPSIPPSWWPFDPGERDALDTLSETVGQAIRRRLENWDSQENETLLYAAGPVRTGEHLTAELIIKGFLQAAQGPLKPTQEELVGVQSVNCTLWPPRLFLSGNYTTMLDEEHATFVRDWIIAPLSWRVRPHTMDWLLPERQMRGVHLPASWLFQDMPTIHTDPEQITMRLREKQVARFLYWNQGLRERNYYDSDSRVGVELLVNREWLEPQFAAGATLFYVAILQLAQRQENEPGFGKRNVVGTWFFGGSRIVWPEPWKPPIGKQIGEPESNPEL